MRFAPRWLVPDDEGARPGIGFWLAIAASAIAGAVNLLRRPDFDPSDLILPGAYTAILVGTLLALRIFWPQTLSNRDRNGGVLIGFGIGLMTTLFLFFSGDLR